MCVFSTSLHPQPVGEQLLPRDLITVTLIGWKLSVQPIAARERLQNFWGKKHIIFSKHCATFSLLLEDKIIQSVNNHQVLEIFMGMEWGWHALY